MIAAVNGACAGIGLIHALMCDVRFAARGARFSTAFARRGLAAEYAISWVLPRYIGVENALDLLLTARTFDADEAHRLGLVSRLCDPGDVLAEAQAYAADIATHCAPAALAAIRHQVYTDLDGGLEEAMVRSLKVMEVTNAGPRRGGGQLRRAARTPVRPDRRPRPREGDRHGSTGRPARGRRRSLPSRPRMK